MIATTSEDKVDLAVFLALIHGCFQPMIDRVFSFEQVHEALAHLASRQHVGKVVIRLDDGGA